MANQSANERLIQEAERLEPEVRYLTVSVLCPKDTDISRLKNTVREALGESIPYIPAFFPGKIDVWET